MPVSLKEQLAQRAKEALAKKEAALKAERERIQAAKDKVAAVPILTPNIPKKEQQVEKLTIAEKIALAKRAQEERIKQLPDKEATEDTEAEVAALQSKVAEQEKTTSIKALLDIAPDMEKIDGFEPQDFIEKLTALEVELERKAPGIATYLAQINTNLNQYPELTYLLNEEQLQLIVNGWFFLTNTAMVEVITKKGSRKKVESEEEINMLFGIS